MEIWLPREANTSLFSLILEFKQQASTFVLAWLGFPSLTHTAGISVMLERKVLARALNSLRMEHYAIDFSSADTLGFRLTRR